MADNRKLTFTGSGGDPLAARLDLPDGPPRAVALFAHCFTCSKDTIAAARISRSLTGLGMAVMRFDFTGLGQSGGEFANTTFSSNVDDLVAAADHLRATLSAPSLLIGHSLGGAAVLAAAARVPEAQAVATLGAPSDPAHVAHLLVAAQDEIETAGEASVLLGGRTFRIKRQFLADIAAQPQHDRIAALDCALLVLHSPQDETVGIDNARIIYEAAPFPKSFISLDGADHLLTRRSDATYVAGVIAAWAVRYLPEPDAATTADSAPDSTAAVADGASQSPATAAVADGASQSPATAAAADGASQSEPGVVVVAEAGTGRYAQTIRIGRHELTADEPPSVGGGDTGPTPYDLLLAGLGACTSMTLRMYADRKGWPLRHTTVRLRHERIHAKDCASCETDTGRLDHIQREIEIDGELTDEQRAQLLAIADRCPVHRTLNEEVLITTRPAESVQA